MQTLPTLKSSELCQHCAWSCSQRPTSRRGSRPRSWDSWLGPLSRKDSRTGRPKCPAITDSEVLKPRHICSSIRKSRGMAPNHRAPLPFSDICRTHCAVTHKSETTEESQGAGRIQQVCKLGSLLGRHDGFRLGPSSGRVCGLGIGFGSKVSGSYKP